MFKTTTGEIKKVGKYGYINTITRRSKSWKFIMKSLELLGYVLLLALAIYFMKYVGK